MKYILLIYGSEANATKRTPEDGMAAVKEYVAVADSLRQNGQLVVAERLQATSTATAVRVREGKTLATDGPFAETKEQLGGFYLIEAKASTRRSPTITSCPPRAPTSCVGSRGGTTRRRSIAAR